MEVKEFKAWLSGFEEALQGKVPTKVQWKKIQEKISEMNDPWPGYYYPNPPIYIPTNWTTPTSTATPVDTILSTSWVNMDCTNTSA